MWVQRGGKHTLEAGGVFLARIIHQANAMGTLIVSLSDDMKSILPSSVPNLELHPLSLDFQHFTLVRDAAGGSSSVHQQEVAKQSQGTHPAVGIMLALNVFSAYLSKRLVLPTPAHNRTVRNATPTKRHKTYLHPQASRSSQALICLWHPHQLHLEILGAG